jgi:protocatechuate 3,4-dioxygenase beta subunit
MEFHDDDKPIGRILSRREMLRLLGGASAAVVVGTGIGNLALTQAQTVTPVATAIPSCVVKPALTEGPYFVDDQLNRSDIRIEPSDGSVKDGMLLNLIFSVSDVSANTCAPLAGAQVDVWHCDAQGAYSGVSDPGFDTSGEKWLRGYQITDEIGKAEFITIYPGWYSGRAVHIHFKIRTDPDSEQVYEFTSQLFFPEDISDIVHAQGEYADKGYRDVLNAEDNIFQSSEGLLTLELIENEDSEGYTANFSIGLDLSEPSPSESGMGGGGNRLPGGAPPNGTPPQGQRPSN